MVRQILKYIRISRPRFWLYLVGPYYIGVISVISSPTELLSLSSILGAIFFLFVGNMYLYGINDFFDADTDQFNPKKQDKEHLLKTQDRKSLRRLLALCGLLYVFFGLLLHENLSRILLLIFFVLSTIYSAPPFRLKAHILFDSLSNVLYILPGLISYYELAGHFPSAAGVVAASLWCVSMHLYSAIPDIEADKKAGLRTTAIWLGHQQSLGVCAVLWSLSVVFCFLATGNILSVLGLMYVLLCVANFFRVSSVDTLYWFFPWINAALGGVLFWAIALYRWSQFL